MGSMVERVIPRNSTLPVAMAQEFTTYKDGQTAMIIHVVQGERDLVKDCRSLAKFTLKGIPPLVAGAAKILVTFQVDADEIPHEYLVEYLGEVLETNPVDIVFVPRVNTVEGLEQSHIDKWKWKISRSLAEAKIDAEQLIELTQKAIDEDSDLLTKKEKDEIYETKRAQSNYDKIKEANKKLNAQSESFAAKRMDRSIQKALTF